MISLVAFALHRWTTKGLSGDSCRTFTHTRSRSGCGISSGTALAGFFVGFGNGAERLVFLLDLSVFAFAFAMSHLACNPP
jgi:hypothetical protein